MGFTSEQVKQLVSAINRKGVILEEQTKKVVNSKLSLIDNGLISTCSPLIFELNKRRYDIDSYVETSNLEIFIECKRTKKQWLFLRKKDEKNVVNVICENNGYKVKTKSADYTILKTNLHNHSISFEIDNKGKIGKTDSEQYQSQPVHKAILQVLNNIQAYLQQFYRKRKNKHAIVPIIVTNTTLLSSSYDSQDIDEFNGDLKNISEPIPIPYVSLQFTTDLSYDINGSQQIHYEDSAKTPTITIFVVNINHLKEFIEKYHHFIGSISYELFGLRN